MNKKLTFALGLACLMLGFLSASAQEQTLNIIPRPSNFRVNPGQFKLTSKTTLYAGKDKAAQEVANFFAEKMRQSTGMPLPLSKKNVQGAIVLQLTPQIQGEESYQLLVSPLGVTAQARTQKGLVYAMQSLMQLFPPEIESPVREKRTEWTAPACRIEDSPRFAYRGIMLDVSRHFFSIKQIKHQIDALSLFKVNYLHLHLSDHQGWRIEIKKYPKLTSVGAWRTNELGRYGGFYTQKELKDLVEYARLRGIEIIPEIDIPGHSAAMVAAYPELSCTGEQIEPMTVWGDNLHVVCPGKETTYQMLSHIIDEMVSIFPCKYFHIGGDECTRTSWESCPACQHRIDSLGVKDEASRTKEQQLHSYLVRRISDMLKAHKKTLVGWDDICEGGDLGQPVIMAYRCEWWAQHAPLQGYQTIITPDCRGLYFDNYDGEEAVEIQAFRGWAPVWVTYSYEPVLEEVSKAGKQGNVMGLQGCLWAEFVLNDSTQDYRLYPRALAIAETGWTPKDKKDFNDFARRLDYSALPRLKRHDIFFHLPMAEQPEGSCDYLAFTDRDTLALKTTRPIDLVYTLDGKQPTAQSARYAEPLVFDQSAVVKVASITPTNLLGRVRTIRLDKQELSPALDEQAGEPGLRVRWAKGTYLSVNDLDKIKDWQEAPVADIAAIASFQNQAGGDYSAIAEGKLKVDADGVYGFRANHAQVWVDDQLVVDNSRNLLSRAMHGGREIALRAGLHRLRIVFLGHNTSGDPTYGECRTVRMRFRRGPFQDLTAEQLFQ